MYKKPQTFFLMLMMLNNATELQLFLCCCPYFWSLVWYLWLGYKATLNSKMYANMRLWALLDYFKEYFTMLTRKATKLHKNWRNTYLICVLWTLYIYLTSTSKNPQAFFLMLMMLNKATELWLFIYIFPYFLVSWLVI